MRIEIDKLDEQGEAFAHTYTPEELTLDEEVRLAEAARVEGEARRKGNQVHLRARLAAKVEAFCDRCAQPVALPFELEFEDRLVPAEAELETLEATELQPEDLALSVYEGDAVEVDDLVREQILLAVPTRLLCREDCKGLCPDCGVDRNKETCACEHKETDPRWAGLAALKDSES
ncbi:MAG TPA: DUF177 domain-containing protein [Pyrinomonadaceae bacterium]|jgi:uncharacterized protein|nr:DUF177 domain-containing protein [Pyrinomonadaceae bacterium]